MSELEREIARLRKMVEELRTVEIPVGGSGGVGDMMKAVYDTDNNGVVDGAEYADDADTVDGQHATAFEAAGAVAAHAGAATAHPASAITNIVEISASEPASLYSGKIWVDIS